MDDIPKDSVIKCARCHFQIFHRRVDSRVRTLAFSIAALILYIPSNLYPIVTAEYQGTMFRRRFFKGSVRCSRSTNILSDRCCFLRAC
ncbi:MAG: paraquat-inducible protein A [Verrucomicrobiia bacterium]